MNRQSMLTVVLAALALAGGTLCGCPTGGGGGPWRYEPAKYNYGHEITVQPDGSYFISGAGGELVGTENKILAAYEISAAGALRRYWTVDGLYPYDNIGPYPGALMLSSGDVVLAGGHGQHIP